MMQFEVDRTREEETPSSSSPSSSSSSSFCSILSVKFPVELIARIEGDEVNEVSFELTSKEKGTGVLIVDDTYIDVKLSNDPIHKDFYEICERENRRKFDDDDDNDDNDADKDFVEEEHHQCLRLVGTNESKLVIGKVQQSFEKTASAFKEQTHIAGKEYKKRRTLTLDEKAADKAADKAAIDIVNRIKRTVAAATLEPPSSSTSPTKKLTQQQQPKSKRPSKRKIDKNLPKWQTPVPQWIVLRNISCHVTCEDIKVSHSVSHVFFTRCKSSHTTALKKKHRLPNITEQNNADIFPWNRHKKGRNIRCTSR